MNKLRDEYTAKIHLELDALNEKVDALESKAHEARTDVRAKYQRELAKLRHQSKLATDKLKEIGDSTEDAWDKAVLEMDKMRTAFLHSVNYFKSQF